MWAVRATSLAIDELSNDAGPTDVPAGLGKHIGGDKVQGHVRPNVGLP